MTDDEALHAFGVLAETEGILPALEPSHALAYVLKEGYDGTTLVGLSGRGDKDVETISELAR
jgi:tryptophan synthase beta chain